MSTIRLVYEILVSGIYPFEGKFEKYGFTIEKNKVDGKTLNNLTARKRSYCRFHIRKG